MNINQINDWKVQTRQKELALWKGRYKRCIRLSKAILHEIDTILYIKEKIAAGDSLGVSEAWNELDYDVQKLLITAPTYGGPFTTKERSEINNIWTITVEMIEE